MLIFGPSRRDKSSLTGLGRTGKQFGPETKWQRDPKEIGTPDEATEAIGPAESHATRSRQHPTPNEPSPK